LGGGGEATYTQMSDLENVTKLMKNNAVFCDCYTRYAKFYKMS